MSLRGQINTLGLIEEVDEEHESDSTEKATELAPVKPSLDEHKNTEENKCFNHTNNSHSHKNISYKNSLKQIPSFSLGLVKSSKHVRASRAKKSKRTIALLRRDKSSTGSTDSSVGRKYSGHHYQSR